LLSNGYVGPTRYRRYRPKWLCRSDPLPTVTDYCRSKKQDGLLKKSMQPTCWHRGWCSTL